METEESEKKTNRQSLTKDVREYVEKRVQLFTIDFAEQVSLMIAHSFQRLAGMLLLAAALFFAWFAVGFYLGELLGTMSGGFALASVPLFVLGFVFYGRKSERVTDKIQAEIIGKVIENFDSDNKNENRDEK